MIVENKPTFEGWFVDDKFGYENITVFGNRKAYFDELIKKTNIIPKIKILKKKSDDDKTMPHILSPTLRYFLSVKIKPNSDKVKKEET